MPKIILRCNYQDNAPAEHLANYVSYIGTRAGVDRIDVSKKNLPATRKQKELITQILADIPDSQEMHEYRDYYLNPTRGNASEFIACAIEQNLHKVATRENYVDYIANRPRVERMGEHGLFTDAGEPVVLSQVQEEVAGREGRLWTHVISLRREDAERLGYDQGARWRSMLRSKRALFSKVMGIPDTELKWYAAFHDEGHHPHVHLMIYSTGSHQGYLNPEGISKIRSKLAHEIFAQDFLHIYKEKESLESSLRSGAEEQVKLLAEQARSGVCDDAEIGPLLLDLGHRLQNTKGKKIYGYLKADLKAKVDSVLDHLAQTESISALYQAWCEWQGKIYTTYMKQAPPPPPLRLEKKFHPIRQLIIDEAMRLAENVPSEEAPEPEEHMDGSEPEEETAPGPDHSEPAPPTWVSGSDSSNAEPPDAGHEDDQWDITDVELNADWTDEYREARKMLYTTGEGRDLPLAFHLFDMEARRGNALAMHDLARMYAFGLGCEADGDAAHTWYASALESFLALHGRARGRRSAYLAYRIGKLYAAGLGCEQDYTAAARYLEEAANAGNKYAQYSLAGLYQRGRGVEQDLVRARGLYQAASDEDFPYASYELSRMCREGAGGPQDIAEAEQHAATAFDGFVEMEQESHEDRLQYRLGCMLQKGEGTQPDPDRAEWYFQQAAEAGNPHAAYRLARLYLSRDDRDEEKTAAAIRWLRKAADAENSQAQYSLGKLLLKGEGVEQDIPQAVSLLELAAKQNHDYAAYSLGRLCEEQKEDGAEGQAEAWYRQASELGNPHAAYRLARLCLEDEAPERRQEGLRWLQMAVDAGNPNAQYTKAKLLLDGELSSASPEEALALLTQAAEQSPNAAYLMGKLYEQGEGVERDLPSAIHWLERAHKSDHPAAGTRLAKLYLKEYPQDQQLRQRAVSLLREAAEKQDPRAQYALARLYHSGELVQQNMSEALRLYQSAARQGNSVAAYQVGKLLHEGRLVPRDAENAVRWLAYAAQLGNEYAQLRLGKLLLAGVEVRRDIPRALHWLQQAADQGNPYAQCALATACLDPEIGLDDPWRARELLAKAAGQGNPHAQYRLGRLLFDDDHLPKEPALAVFWLERACAQAYGPALRVLGMRLIAGEDVPRDVARGMSMLEQAAAQGDPFTQYQLGKLLLLGQQVSQDRDGARRWLELSAGQGNQYAQFLLDHFEQFQGAPAALAATRLLHHLSRIIEGNHIPPPGSASLLIDRKRRRKLREKLVATGHAQDDSQEAMHR